VFALKRWTKERLQLHDQFTLLVRGKVADRFNDFGYRAHYSRIKDGSVAVKLGYKKIASLLGA
jgi:hypothetical protein